MEDGVVGLGVGVGVGVGGRGGGGGGRGVFVDGPGGVLGVEEWIC